MILINDYSGKNSYNITGHSNVCTKVDIINNSVVYCLLNVKTEIHHENTFQIYHISLFIFKVCLYRCPGPSYVTELLILFNTQSCQCYIFESTLLNPELPKSVARA